MLETFARLVEVFRFFLFHFSGRVLFDFDGEYPDLVCLVVKENDIIEVSLR